MKLYGLVIGINEYVPDKFRLNQAADDADKMQEYLEGLDDHFDDINIIALLDKDATRQNIIDNVRNHLYKATDDDVAIFYYSGHGALEKTSGIFPDEYDNALDCLVCYSDEKPGPKAFLANKEIRYLFHKMPHTPHLVTAIDSCHSGDIVRSINSKEEEPERALKRLSGVFPSRNFEEFEFAKDDSVVKRNGNSVTVEIPFKPSVHLAACLSSESSWEDLNGGVFTFFLLLLLENSSRPLNYLDISRYAKLSIVGVTKEQQTPKVSVQGDGTKINQYSPWLNIPFDQSKKTEGEMVSNAKGGWLYTRGSVLGMKKGMEVEVEIEPDWKEVFQIKSVTFEHSVLDVPTNIASDLNFDIPYRANTVKSIYSSLKLFVNDIDGNVDLTDVNKFLEDHDKVEIVNAKTASFLLNSFGGMLYFTSSTESTFQPFAEQLIAEKLPNLVEAVDAQLRSIVKWNHFYTLENLDNNFDKSPIKIEARPNDLGDWIDVTNSVLELKPQSERLPDGRIYGKYKLKISNQTSTSIFIGALGLNSNMSITTDALESKSIELLPEGQDGNSISFYYHKSGVAGAFMETYKEVYNWKSERHYYKFIFNNFGDFSNSLASKVDFLSPALPPPITIDPLTRGPMKQKGGGALSDEVPVEKKWGTALVTVELPNPNNGKVIDSLDALWDDYQNHPNLGPMFSRLYPDK